MTRKKISYEALPFKSPYRLPIVKRSCMKCQKTFNSLGPMNRICFDCNESNSKSAKRVERGGTRGSLATNKGGEIS